MHLLVFVHFKPNLIMLKRLRKSGPGVLIAAAFIGPGTVTTCTVVGVQFGYALLWAMLLSIIATMVLQEMAVRVGIVTQKGLAEVIKQELKKPVIRIIVIVLILSAIVIGNAAYEAGNIGGAALGIEAIFGKEHASFYPIIIGLCAFLLLIVGSYKFLERCLVVLVLLMSVSFIATAIITKPDFVAIFKGLFIPTIPKDGILSIIALVGTTVVPYNLFLHASLVKEKWKSTSQLGDAKKDAVIAIAVGGMVSMAIIIAATAIKVDQVTSALDLAIGLEPLYGNMAKYSLGIGLFAAGISSAITAPLAAAYVANSCFGWKAGLKDYRFRIVWILILGLGVFFLSFGISIIEIIKFAQVANGILLPLIAVFLLWIVNKTSVLGKYKNTMFQNILALAIIILAVILGLKSIFKVFELI